MHYLPSLPQNGARLACAGMPGLCVGLIWKSEAGFICILQTISQTLIEHFEIILAESEAVTKNIHSRLLILFISTLRLWRMGPPLYGVPTDLVALMFITIFALLKKVELVGTLRQPKQEIFLF